MREIKQKYRDIFYITEIAKAAIELIGHSRAVALKEKCFPSSEEPLQATG